MLHNWNGDSSHIPALDHPGSGYAICSIAVPQTVGPNSEIGFFDRLLIVEPLYVFGAVMILQSIVEYCLPHRDAFGVVHLHGKGIEFV